MIYSLSWGQLRRLCDKGPDETVRVYTFQQPAAWEAALDRGYLVDFVRNGGDGKHQVWSARAEGCVLTLRVRADGRGMSDLSMSERGDPVFAIGFGGDDAWAEIPVGRSKLTWTVTDHALKGWVSDLARHASGCGGTSFPIVDGVPRARSPSA